MSMTLYGAQIKTYMKRLAIILRGVQHEGSTAMITGSVDNRCLKHFAPEEVSSMILQKMRTTAENYLELDKEITHAIVTDSDTVPAVCSEYGGQSG